MQTERSDVTASLDAEQLLAASAVMVLATNLGQERTLTRFDGMYRTAAVVLLAGFSQIAVST
ncbi:hypothetical protein ACWEO2_02570 [Nocardia sp. NPDC004278]